MDLDSVCAQLYALPPSEFTAARNDAARQARADGDPDLAAHIKGLGRPTTSAWLVNRLAREPDAGLPAVVELGQDLRQAMAEASGDQLRALTRRRHQVVAALVSRARELGAAHGIRVSDTVAAEVQQTLEAALAEPAVAEQVLAGRLAHAAEHAGFGSMEPPGEQGAADVADLTARRRESAERALAEASRRAHDAAERHEESQERTARARDDVAAAEHQLEQRRLRLAEAERDTADTAEALAQARERESEAEHALRSLSQT